MKLKTTLAALALATAAIFTHHQAQAWNSCDRWGHTVLNGYDVWNDGWGSSFNSQCITATANGSGINFYVDTTQPNGGGVQSYPNASKNINKKISNYYGWGGWTYSIPSGTTYWDAAFDIWVPTEVMVWVGQSSGVHPRGSQQVSNVSIAGHSWNVWRENTSYNVISFVRTSNSYNGSVDLRKMLDYARLTKGWLGDTTIAGNGLGFEIFGTGNVQKRYTMSYAYIGS